jgi:hypothetical protein
VIPVYSVVKILVLGLRGGDDFFEILENGGLDNGGLVRGDIGLGGREIPQLVFHRAFHVGVLGDLVIRFGEFGKLIGEGFLGFGECVHKGILTPLGTLATFLFKDGV